MKIIFTYIFHSDFVAVFFLVILLLCHKFKRECVRDKKIILVNRIVFVSVRYDVTFRCGFNINILVNIPLRKTMIAKGADKKQ